VRVRVRVRVAAATFFLKWLSMYPTRQSSALAHAVCSIRIWCSG